jgi:hypothetical protein
MIFRNCLFCIILAFASLWSDGFVRGALAETPAGRLTVDSPGRVIPTAIAKGGQAAAVIVIPEGSALFRQQAKRINKALKKRGITLPVEFDSAYRDLSGLKKNLILLGDRDSNRAIRKLYYLHYTLLDARYPGKGGSELRSLHNPFGDGFNIVFAGGCDETGVSRAVDGLIAELERAPLKDGNLQLGYLQAIHLGEGITPPADARNAISWEHSAGYGGNGYFGWNWLSRNLALFYMTGDERYATEFLRLAFPDAETAAELVKVDKEAYDDPSNPLAKPYHYHAIMMILYWDLVEESPAFTPEIRLEVRRKFAEQFYYYWPGRGAVNRNAFANPFHQTAPAVVLGGRHQLWDAASLYALARYFNKSNPCADVQTALDVTANVFAPFDQHLAIRVPDRGEGIHWYNTHIEAAFLYAALSDPLRYEGSPVVKGYADVLAKLSDRTTGNWSARYSTPFFLNLVASMTGDQAFAGHSRFSPGSIVLAGEAVQTKFFHRECRESTSATLRRRSDGVGFRLPSRGGHRFSFMAAKA